MSEREPFGRPLPTVDAPSPPGRAGNRSRNERQPTFRVRDLPVYGDLILAPMAGFSDLPYRSLCREYGSAMSYTEFVAVEAILRATSDRPRQMLAYLPGERPVTFQIFGNCERLFEEAALRIQDLGPDIIDINMGCSVNNVSGRGAGAGLLKDPSKIGRIFNRLTRVLSVPVTGKIRLGWDQGSLNYLDVLKALEDNGVSLIAVHARTKSQAYKGKADWDAIARIVEKARVPVIGNGDVVAPEDIERIKRHTGCTAVMIGRGAIGHPWIFQRRARSEISFEEKALFMRRHFERMLEFYGERMALILIRKHVARYLKHYSGIRDLHVELVTVKSIRHFHELLEELTERLAESEPEAAPTPA